MRARGPSQEASLLQRTQAAFMLLTMARAKPRTGIFTSSGTAPAPTGRATYGAAAEAAAGGGAAAWGVGRGAAAAAAGGPAGGAAACPPAATKPRMSSLVTRPSLPLPRTRVMSTSCSRAMRRTAGVARDRSEESPSAPAPHDPPVGAAAAEPPVVAARASSGAPAPAPSSSTSISSSGLPVGAMSPTL